MFSSSLGHTVTLDELAVDPYPLVARLRAHEPVAWVPSMDRWLVSRRDLILTVLDDASHFTTNHPRSLIRTTFGAQMLSTDGDEQRRHRRPFAPAFRPRALQSTAADVVQSRARELVSQLDPGDDVTTAASVMAVSTVLDMVGLSDVAGVDTVTSWYDSLAAALANVADDAEVAQRGRQAAAAFGAAMAQATGQEPPQDSTGLDDQERISNTLLVLFGGIETTQSAILNALWSLAVHQDAQGAVRRSRALLGPAVEESLRWEPAVATLTRFTSSRVELEGVSIPADSIVECLIAGANRDPQAFDEPDRYDISRANAAGHLTFGGGRHYCLGAHLARMEAVAVVDALLDRTGSCFTLADPRADGPRGHEFRHPQQLRLVW